MKRKAASPHLAPGDWDRIIVPVSGGKDSQACFALAVDAVGPGRVLGVHQHTGFDHSLTYAHMDYMRGRYGAPIVDIKSEKYADVPDVMLGEVMIPGRHARMCTRQLKTGPWFRWLARQPDRGSALVFLGMRAAESADRRDNYGALSDLDVYNMGDISGECLASCRTVRVQMPIVSWSTPAVYAFLRARGDRINPLYAKGHKRVGCFPCVLAGKASMRLTARDPEGRENLARVGDAVRIVQWARKDAFFDHDVDDPLSGVLDPDPFGFLADDGDTAGAGCSWCNL